MIVEDADRFGLSQLHQLRGRVGRGARRVVVLPVRRPDDAATARRGWRRWPQSTDGFELAEKDLEIRGAGEVFGERQSGMTDLKLGRIPRDEAIVIEARAVAEEILDDDPDLAAPRAAARRGRGPPRRRRRVPLQELSRPAAGCAVIAGSARAGRRLVAPDGRRRPADQGHRARGGVLRARRARRARRRASCSTSTRAAARSAIEALSRGRGARGARRPRPRRRCDAIRAQPRDDSASTTGARGRAVDVGRVPRRAAAAEAPVRPRVRSTRRTTHPTTRSRPSLAALAARRAGSRRTRPSSSSGPSRATRSRCPTGWRADVGAGLRRYAPVVARVA